MKHLTIASVACLILWLTSCGGGEEKMSSMSLKDTQSKTSPEKSNNNESKINRDEATKERNETPPMASNTNLKQTNREFVRTAEARLEVKNVYKTTLELEDVVSKYKGFITETTLRNEVVRTEDFEVSRDSVLHTTLYRVNNHLVIRLPQDSLDLFMHNLSKWLVFLDYRIIKADDVTLALKSQDLKALRNDKYQQRYTKAIDNQGQKLEETARAEDNLLQHLNNTDQNALNKEALQHQIQYSTLVLDIYQAETIHRNMIENYRKIEQYQPSFGAKMLASLATGWSGVLSFVVVIFAVWPLLILVGLGAWFMLRKLR